MGIEIWIVLVNNTQTANMRFLVFLGVFALVALAVDAQDGYCVAVAEFITGVNKDDPEPTMPPMRDVMKRVKDVFNGPNSSGIRRFIQHLFVDVDLPKDPMVLREFVMRLCRIGEILHAAGG